MWAYVYVMLIHIVNRTHIANPARRVRRRTPPATPALANRRAARTTLRDAASFDSRCPSPESTSRRPARSTRRRLARLARLERLERVRARRFECTCECPRADRRRARARTTDSHATTTRTTARTMTSPRTPSWCTPSPDAACATV